MQHLAFVKSLTQGLVLTTTLLSLSMSLFAQEKGPAFFGIGGVVTGKPMGKPDFKPDNKPSTPSMPSTPIKPAPADDYVDDYDRGGRGGHGRPGHGGNRYSYTEYLQAFINRTLMGEKVIAVKQLLNLGYGKYGKAIYQVKLEAKSMFGMGTAQLLINGRPASMPERLSPMLSEKTFEISGFANKNEIDIKKLQILLKGQTYVSKVGIVIQK